MKTIEELKAENLPHAVFEKTFELPEEGEVPPEELAKLKASFELSRPKMDEYLKTFVPRQMHSCIRCGAMLVGGMFEQLLGMSSFELGLAYGEGHCRECKYPSRVYHTVEGLPEGALSDGKTTLKFTGIMQYHPDNLESVKSSTAEE